MPADIEKVKGRRFPTRTYTVERGKIKEFAEAIGDPNPVYTDPEVARSYGYPDVIAPPTFATVIDHWSGMDFSALCQTLDVDPVKVLHGGQEYNYYGMIVPSDVITIEGEVVDAFSKKGSSGGMNFIVIENTYTNQRGEVVVVAKSTIIERH